jgi:hypothetical protein
MLVEVNRNVFVRDEYPIDGFPTRKESTWTCWHYSLKAVIEAKTHIKKWVREYSWWKWSYHTWFMTPRSVGWVLKKHWISYKFFKIFFLTPRKKIELMKKRLIYWPILIFIANWLVKDKRFSRKKALTHRHYITIWGYDDNDWTFFVYDSSCVRPMGWLPIWNIKIPYKYIIKERNLWFYKFFSNRWISVIYDD